MNETLHEEHEVSALPAFDRLQARPDPRPRAKPPGWLWALLATLVLIGIALTTWWLWPDESSEANILVHLVETSDTFRPDLVTTQPDDARSLVLDALGWDVAPPDLPALTIVGVGIPSIGEIRPAPNASPAEVQIPAFRYEGSDGERALLFAYDYILLDRVQSVFDLPEGTYAGLSEPTPVDSRVVDGRFVVSWRRRSMIFTAVTPDEPVAERIRRAVAS